MPKQSKKDTQPIGPNQEAWLKALESGEYKQCKGSLSTGGGYCCLGVACKVKGMKGKESRDEEEGKIVLRFSDSTATAPGSVVKHLCLRDDMGTFSRVLVSEKDLEAIEKAKAECTDLATLNDDAGWSFKRIARFIRRNPQAVFTKPK